MPCSYIAKRPKNVQLMRFSVFFIKFQQKNCVEKKPFKLCIFTKNVYFQKKRKKILKIE